MSPRKRRDPANPRNLGELVETLWEISDLPPLERARLARQLERPMRTILAALGNEATFEAAQEVVEDGELRRRRTHAEVAEALGVSVHRVRHAIRDHRDAAGLSA